MENDSARNLVNKNWEKNNGQKFGSVYKHE